MCSIFFFFGWNGPLGIDENEDVLSDTHEAMTSYIKISGR